MGAHAVGHHEQMAAASPIGIVGGQHDGVGVLIVAAPQADVAQRGAFQRAARCDSRFGRVGHVRFHGHMGERH